MSGRAKVVELDLPKQWPTKVRAALVTVVSIATIILTRTRAYGANSPISRVRLQAALDQTKTEVAMLREELRLKDARLARLDARKRPHYKPAERLAILELRAARGWSLAETARHLLVEPATISDWERSLSQQGREAFVCATVPVNRFPAYVTYLVQRLQALCPRLGTKKVAQVLARAGLHIGVTTVRRMLARPTSLTEPPDSEVTPNMGITEDIEGAARAELLPEVHPEAKPQPEDATQPETTPQPELKKTQPVHGDRPNHVWEIDFTLVPTAAGFWLPWFPNAMRQCWPFCWWVAIVVDVYSRKVMGFSAFGAQPNAVEVCSFLDDVSTAAAAQPKYLVQDRGGQFTSAEYAAWCEKKGIVRRFSASYSFAATAIIERLNRTFKDEHTRPSITPLRRDEARARWSRYFDWYNDPCESALRGGAERVPRAATVGRARDEHGGGHRVDTMQTRGDRQARRRESRCRHRRPRRDRDFTVEEDRADGGAGCDEVEG
ncbi:MAG: DDE-type integrase/transposase/recombinase [Deltaproteobacteria bacterium]|nr:DDE-type integrase/transposase/recombinase [Deltaproteobacteria bacterium]